MIQQPPDPPGAPEPLTEFELGMLTEFASQAALAAADLELREIDNLPHHDDTTARRAVALEKWLAIGVEVSINTTGRSRRTLDRKPRYLTSRTDADPRPADDDHSADP